MNYKIILLLIVISFGLMVFAQGVVSAEAVGMDNASASSVKVATTVTPIIPTNGSYVLIDPQIIIRQPTVVTNASSDTFLQPTNLTSTLANWTPAPYSNNTRITQGQCVEVGGTYDVSGVIGFTTQLDYNAFGYYTRYESGFDPFDNFSVTYVYKMPFQRQAYYHFYIDPAIFSDRQGYWYQFNGAFERAANKRAFYVSDKCIKSVNETIFTDEENKVIGINPKIIEPRHSGSDILLANDNPLIMNITGEYQMWIFGETKRILNAGLIARNETNPNTVFGVKTSTSLNVGYYNLVLENYGDNGRYDVTYENNSRSSAFKDLLIPDSRKIAIEDITGLQPKMIESVLKGILKKTDDPVLTYTIDLQNPYISIDGYQELRVGNRTFLEVTGYTNEIANTPITLYIDREAVTQISVKYPSMTVMTEDGYLGDYRTFHGYLPLVYNNTAPGFHTLMAVLPNGRVSKVDFYVREEPKDHYKDPVFYKFIDGNPFYVPPTPVVVEKVVVKEVIKEVPTLVYIPVDYPTLAVEMLKKAIPWIAAGLLIVIPLGYGCLLAIRVYAERRTKKQLENIK